MKTLATTTPISSSKSSSTPSESSNCYFPGCQKDANCNCQICIASMNAAFDLMPESVQRSTLTKLSAMKRRHSATGRRELPRSPIMFNSSSHSTPDSGSSKSTSIFPELDSESELRFHDKKKTKAKRLGFGVLITRVLLGLVLILWFEFGLSPILSGIMGPELSSETVKSLGEKSRALNGLNERLVFFRNELQRYVGEEVSNCSSDNSLWKVDQDGFLLNSRCTFYKSLTEEVSIWGWPLQTAGLLSAGYCSRSFTLLSGRFTEWKNGELGYSIRRVNSSWTQGGWSSSAVQLDPNTWILEYSEIPIRSNTKLISALLEFLKYKLAKKLKRLKQQFWLWAVFGRSQMRYLGAESFRVPT
ncbi:unnamed protein product [Cuscuta epithymum]|uniref:Uncharacterized protein n=1 Tax=Cuscuta epithymum TaxID=186058 RepID=A0AAV0FBT7_9ASTE|nr:unnamed protein product [Cuscuta epithymum]